MERDEAIERKRVVFIYLIKRIYKRWEKEEEEEEDEVRDSAGHQQRLPSEPVCRQRTHRAKDCHHHHRLLLLLEVGFS